MTASGRARGDERSPAGDRSRQQPERQARAAESSGLSPDRCSHRSSMTSDSGDFSDSLMPREPTEPAAHQAEERLLDPRTPTPACGVTRVRLLGVLMRGPRDTEEFSNVWFDFFTRRKKSSRYWW